MKRFISTILTLAMLLSFCTVFAATSVSAATVISNTSPAITANVGEKITLSNYSVVFDGATSATSNLTWKNESGTTITSITPSEKGVTKLTATSGSKSKTIYLVAKLASETEYVLYEVDFSKYSNTTQLKNEGWNLLGNASNHAISGGTYVLGSTSDSYARAILPTWLGDFGDYGIEANLKMLSTTDTGRWVGLVYRIQNANGAYYPYYHMCVRENTLNSGIEFAERTTSDGWNVVRKASSDISSLKSTYNTLKVEAYGKNIKYSINNSQVLYIDETAISTSKADTTAATYTKGLLGLTMNYGTVAFKTLKVTVQPNAPVKEAIKTDLINIDHDELNLLNPIANVQRISDEAILESDDAPNSVYKNVSKISDLSDFLRKCMRNNILPILYVNSTADNDKLAAAMNDTGCKDVTAVATNASILADLRTKKQIVRTGLIINNPSTYATYHDLRVAVRSAPATFCVIPSTYATKELVSEVQEYAVAVWAAIPSGTTEFELEAITAVTAGVNGIISDDASAVTAAINENLVEDAMTRTPVMIGHRGNPTQAPENSLSGFIKAYENGADVFEVDVEITKDKQIIIMHDSTLNRTTNYTGSLSVNQMTLAEVKQYYILDKSGNVTNEKVPTLKEVCDYFQDKDCKIFVEFKGSNASNVPTTLELLDTYNMDYLVDVISFSSNFLAQTQTNSPGMSTGYLLSGQNDGTTWEAALKALNTYLLSAQSANSTINPACEIVRSAGDYFTQAATDRGMTVWPWTYTYSSNDIGFFSGCDGVTTDDVQWAFNMSKKLEAEDFSLVVGQSYVGGCVISEAYGNHKTVIDIKDTVFSVITGEDCVAVVDGKLVALKEGTAKVIFGYQTASTTGTKYVTYTQPVTITVGAGTAESLELLLDIAENATIAEYTSEDINAIREFYEEAKNANISEMTTEELNEMIVEFSTLLNNFVYEDILSAGKEYTTSSTPHATYGDAGGVLTDGAKGGYDGGTKGKYAGFSDTSGVVVDIDLGEVTDFDTFRAYIAGGTWGISIPKRLTVSVSDDGESFTVVNATDKAILNHNTENSWKTYVMQIKLDEKVTGRYVRFSFTPVGTFVWPDELEVSRSNNGRPASDNSVYIQSFNTKIDSGDSTIFTPDFGTITVENANHAWTANLIAKWSDDLDAYVVKEVFYGTGLDTTPDVTLASDEILIVSHKWDVYDTDSNPIVGSKQNTENLYGANVGDVIVLEGIDVENKTLSAVAPHISFVHVHVPGDEATCTKDQTCDLCGEIVTAATGHDEGEWKTLDNGNKERRCTKCGTLLETVKAEVNGIIGDVNNDGKIDQYDYILVKRHYFETRKLTDDELSRADVNKDKKVDQYDYILICRHYFGTYKISN